MRKEEFLEKLRARLSQTMSAQEVTEQIRYYDNYIQEQMRTGKTEEEVLEQLGDPLLIAKTLMDVQETRQEEPGYFAHQRIYDEQEQQEENAAQQQMHHLEIRTKGGCLVAAFLVILVLGLLAWAAGTIVIRLLPVLIPVMIILLVVTYIRQK